MFLDEKGEFISGAYITALLADILLEKQGNNNKIIFDPRVIWPTLKVCRQRGAQAAHLEKWPRLHQRSHAKRKCHLRRRNERHYYFRENFYADNGVIPFLLVVEYLSKTGKSFSEMMRQYMEGHFMSGELNYRVEDVNKIIEAVKSKFSKEGTEISRTGIRLRRQTGASTSVRQTQNRCCV